jgi:hypothetical protein
VAAADRVGEVEGEVTAAPIELPGHGSTVRGVTVYFKLDWLDITF